MTALQLASRDDRLTTTRSGVRWREGWQWPGETEAFLAGLIKELAGPVLHVCCGSSRLGDVRVDMFHPGADMRADAFQLPFKSGSFGVVVADPPFPHQGQGGWDYAARLAFVQECGRVIRKGGVLIIHAPWMPRPSWAQLELPVHIREDVGHAFPKEPLVISRWRRTVEPPPGIEDGKVP